MESALIGLVGLLIGIVLNEYLRRRHRIEQYSVRIFDKRLEIYEGLMSKVSEASSLMDDIIENSELNDEERRAIAFEAGLNVMEYTDKNDMYLNNEIVLHCGGPFIGALDIFDMSKGEEKSNQIKEFKKGIKITCDMIKKESGIEELNKLFKSITKARHGSPIIDYYRLLKKKQKRSDQKA